MLDVKEARDPDEEELAEFWLLAECLFQSLRILRSLARMAAFYELKLGFPGVCLSWLDIDCILLFEFSFKIHQNRISDIVSEILTK